MIVSGWTIDRGRSYELDKNAPGRATITMIDVDGSLDPADPTYDFRPGTPGAIALHNPVTDTDHTLFRGWISRYRYMPYPTFGYAMAEVEMLDGLDRLARMEMYGRPGDVLVWGDAAFLIDAQDGDVWFDADDTGAAVANRINSVLNSAQWPIGLREIFSGNVRLQEVTYPFRTSALTAITDAADAEFPGVANVYCQKTGEFTFHGRLARLNPGDVQYHIRNWNAGDLANAGGGTALIFEPFSYGEDIDKVINSCTATPKGIRDADIVGQTVEDAGSIGTYGVGAKSFDNLLTAGDHFDDAPANVATRRIAEFYVTNHAEPRLRVDQLTFKRLPPENEYAEDVWELMCGIDISDIISLWTPSIVADFFVEGLHYVARPGGEAFDDVTLTVDLSPRSYYNANPWA